MKEGPPDKPNFRVIDGGKKELKELPRSQETANARNANIESVRKLSPSLDLYLSQRPTDKFERMSLVDEISKELWDLPVGGPDARNAASERIREKLGERPRHASPGFHTWRDTTDEQLAWDELYALEHANSVGEKLRLIAEQERKISALEDHLTDAAARHYEDDESPDEQR